ncbi:hypothetical protein BASA81_002659 [Batrachochytrium salamandrivorans]|nr:hypothetical protein BASA81_002659 [Batrachochytrium salamandrivorans]
MLSYQQPPRTVQEQVSSLSASEQEALASLRSYWSSKSNSASPPTVFYDDYMLLRFLRASPGATKFNLSTATKVSESYLKWSNECHIHGQTLEQVLCELEKEIYVVGPGNPQRNRDGHATLYFRPSRMIAKETNPIELLRGVTYQLTKMTEEEYTAVNGVCILTDMTGWAPAANFSLPLTQALLGIMQGKFPCRIRRLVVYNAPLSATVLWGAVKPFFGELAKKLVFVNKQTIHQEFPDLNSLPVSMGGKLDLTATSKRFIQHHQAKTTVRI